MSTNQQAEVKPFKVGEPSADNAGGNPEPSTVKYTGACVETRRKVCVKCGGEIPATKYSNAKYCSDRCRNATIAYNYAVRKGKIKTPGVGSGGAQLEEANSQFKNGKWTYRRKGATINKGHCERCGTTIRRLLVHHKDHDRENHSEANLEILCWSCHRKHHGNQHTKRHT